MRKVVFVVLSVLFFSFSMNVQAKEVYYLNKNGVEFTKEEYDFLSKMFWNGSQDLFTSSDYIKFIESDIMNGELDTKYYIPMSTYATTVKSGYKTLKISKSCSRNCLISVTATWDSVPSVKSYDVIGARLDNTKLVNNGISTTVSSSSAFDSSNEKQILTGGFGVSVKLPTSGNNIVVNQTFRVEKKGTVYASYQHAMNNISLQDSKKYTISSGGYGGVFKFSGVASSTYDKMNGVSISL